jgi:hypothetical protein
MALCGQIYSTNWAYKENENSVHYGTLAQDAAGIILVLMHCNIEIWQIMYYWCNIWLHIDCRVLPPLLGLQLLLWLASDVALRCILPLLFRLATNLFGLFEFFFELWERCEFDFQLLAFSRSSFLFLCYAACTTLTFPILFYNSFRPTIWKSCRYFWRASFPLAKFHLQPIDI